MAKTFKSAHGVLTTVLAAAIVHAAFVYIWEQTWGVGGLLLE